MEDQMMSRSTNRNGWIVELLTDNGWEIASKVYQNRKDSVMQWEVLSLECPGSEFRVYESLL
jgi:hypothetical protein